MNSPLVPSNSNTWSAVRLNNHGVLLFELGLLQEARQAFQQAVKQLAALGGISRPTKDAEDDKLDLSTIFADAEWSHEPLLLFKLPASPSGGGSFLYTRALLIPPKHDSSDTLKQFLVHNCYTASLLWNLALTLHTLAIKTASSATFRKAAQMYYFSLKVVRGIDTTREYCPTLNLLHLALVNNAKQIFQDELAEYDAADGLARALCQQLTQLGKSGALEDMPQNDRKGFVQNVLLRQAPSNAAAA